MNKKILLLLFLFAGYLVSGQEVQLRSASIATAGVGPENGLVNISKWQLGEVHQFILKKDELKMAPAINAEIRAFPNPFSTMINLQFDKDYSGDFTIHVTDVSGKDRWMSERRKIVAGDIVKVDLSHLEAAIYLIYIISADNKTMHVFKVRKL